MIFRELGFVGQADLVEFHKNDTGVWIPYPVEYKRGKPKKDNCDKVQLCAQGMRPEEMYRCGGSGGFLVLRDNSAAAGGLSQSGVEKGDGGNRVADPCHDPRPRDARSGFRCPM